MAKQTGPNPFTGRRGNLLGYRIGKQYYVRVISNLTAKRVKQDPTFKLTMHYAGLLGRASKIASTMYGLLPEQKHGFYRKLTGMAMQLLKQGKTSEETFQQLYNDYKPAPASIEVRKGMPVSDTSFPDKLLTLLFSKPLPEFCLIINICPTTHLSLFPVFKDPSSKSLRSLAESLSRDDT